MYVKYVQQNAVFCPNVLHHHQCSHSQLKVICLDNATVSKATDLTRSCKLHQSGRVGSWSIDKDSYSYTLFSTDAIAVAGRYIPEAPRYALKHLLAPA